MCEHSYADYFYLLLTLSPVRNCCRTSSVTGSVGCYCDESNLLIARTYKYSFKNENKSHFWRLKKITI